MNESKILLILTAELLKLVTGPPDNCDIRAVLAALRKAYEDAQS